MSQPLYAIAQYDVVEAQPPPKQPTSLSTSRGLLIGIDPALQDVLRTVQRIANASCTVLVTGESGTGKELVVAALHDASPRAEAPLIAVNCGAIPENLVESELFGHAKGAFTGAADSSRGLVGAAEGGTLFLDEVGELPLAVQVKILRLLQSREYQAVGDARTRTSNIRIVAATNRDLEADVRRGAFREDLYFRLNVVRLHLPPLRERGADVCLLADHFFLEARSRASRPELVGLSEATLAALREYDWPGNIRALENCIERAVLFAPGPWVEPSDLPPRRTALRRYACPPLPEAGLNLRAAVDELETGLIRQALERTGGNKNRAAQLLGLNRTTLGEMVKRKRIT